MEAPTVMELNAHMIAIHFPESKIGGDADDEESGGYQCRHCEVKFPGMSDIRQHLTEVHDIKTGLAMHYLNRCRED
jgi:predicted aldo/keto reductase-like oxidoreductase